MISFERINKIFASGIRKRHVVLMKTAILGFLGILLLSYAVFLACVVEGIGWAYFAVVAALGIRLVGREIISLLHREWLDECKYMLKFLNGEHNQLAWVYLSADKDPGHKLAEPPETDGLSYWLTFWFTNKTSCKVYGRKAVLNEILLYFCSHHTDITTGFSRDIAEKFAMRPQQLKSHPVHVDGVSGKEKPPVFMTERLAYNFHRPLMILAKSLGKLGRVIWFCISFSISIYFLTSFGYELYLSLTCENWSSVQGEISYIYSDNQRLEYTFVVDGVLKTGNRISFSGQNENPIEEYPLHSPVTVYYDPANPSQSVLIPSALGFAGYVPLFLGVLFIGLGWICFGWGIGKYRTITNPVYW